MTNRGIARTVGPDTLGRLIVLACLPFRSRPPCPLTVQAAHERCPPDTGTSASVGRTPGFHPGPHVGSPVAVAGRLCAVAVVRRPGQACRHARPCRQGGRCAGLGAAYATHAVARSCAVSTAVRRSLRAPARRAVAQSGPALHRSGLCAGHRIRRHPPPGRGALATPGRRQGAAPLDPGHRRQWRVCCGWTRTGPLAR